MTALSNRIAIVFTVFSILAATDNIAADTFESEKM